MKLQAKSGKLIHSGRSNSCLYIVTIVVLLLLAAGAVIYFVLSHDRSNWDTTDHDDHHPNRTTRGVAVDVKSCHENSTTVLSQLRLSPYPLQMPSNVSASFSLLVGRTIKRKTIMKYKLMKKVFFWWITIDPPTPAPSDICDVWPLPGPDCPPAYMDAGIPCSCPIPVGLFELDILSRVGFLGDFGLPKVVASGRYWAQIDVDDEDGNKLLCHEVEIDIN